MIETIKVNGFVIGCPCCENPMESSEDKEGKQFVHYKVFVNQQDALIQANSLKGIDGNAAKVKRVLLVMSRPK